MVNAVLDIEFNLHNKIKFQPEFLHRPSTTLESHTIHFYTAELPRN